MIIITIIITILKIIIIITIAIIIITIMIIIIAIINVIIMIIIMIIIIVFIIIIIIIIIVISIIMISYSFLLTLSSHKSNITLFIIVIMITSKRFNSLQFLLLFWIINYDLKSCTNSFSTTFQLLFHYFSTTFSGLLVMLLAEVTEAVRLVLTQFLLQNLKFGVVEGQYVLAPASAFWLFLASAV